MISDFQPLELMLIIVSDSSFFANQTSKYFEAQQIKVLV